MSPRLRSLLLAAAVGLTLAASAQAACPAVPRGQPLPAEAVPGQVFWPPWRVGVDQLSERLRQADIPRTRLVFLGDSITESWDPRIFNQFYGTRGPLNLGVGGDMTQGTLWRLENGHWPAGLRPEVIVLMIGTNNIFNNGSPENIARGISAIITRLQQLSPSSRILLLGVTPRGATPADPARPVVTRVNQLIAGCADNRRVFFANPGLLLVDGQGNLGDYIAPDMLHPTIVGYAIIATSIEPVLRQMLSAR